jgi:hypothetical protein
MGYYEDIKTAREDIDFSLFSLETYTFEDDVRALIERRDDKFLNGFRSYITLVDEKLAATKYNSIKKAKPLKPYDLRSYEEKNTKYERILFHFRKAVNLLKLYQLANIYSKPLVGYYAIYSVAQAIFDLTFEGERDDHHGICMGGLNECGRLTIMEKKYGLFQAFADSLPYQFGRLLWVLTAGQRLTFEEVTRLVVDYPESGNDIGAFGPFFSILPPGNKHSSMIHPIIRYYLYFYMLSNYARYPSAVWQKKTNTNSSREYYSILSSCETAMAGFLRFSCGLIEASDCKFEHYNQILTEINIPSIK